VSNATPARRVIYLIPSIDHMCVRHRVDAFIPTLQGRGWIVEKWVIPRSFLGRLRFFWGLRGADVVVVLRKLFSRCETRLLRGWSRCLIFDFDDAIMYRDSSRAERRSHRREKRFGCTGRCADLVIAGNGYLGELAGRAGGKVTVVPTCVDDEALYAGSGRGTGGRVVIGWIGSRSTVMYLEALRPVFEELHRRYGSSVVLKVVCDVFPGPMGVEVIEKRWSLAEEADDLRSFDVGVMPLPDDMWTRGKCGLKLLQYMGAAVPAVASPVGVACEMIHDGENGFLARTHDEWIRVLSRLIEDAELRRRVGEAGRRSLRGRYTVSAWADRYVDLIEGAAGL